MGSGSWTFMVPVDGLLLMEAVAREFRVDRVTLVHRDKLPRVRKRLGLGATISEVKKTIPGWDFFDVSLAYAVMKQRGEPEEVQRQCLAVIREELSILALSQLGYSRRRQMRPIALVGENTHPYVTFLAYNDRNGTRFGKMFMMTTPINQVVLDGGWKEFQDGVFFTQLLGILRGKTKVEESWRCELRRAAVLIGESVGTKDLLKSFVWNWVALEMLLTHHAREALNMLPRRAEALLGWATYWEPDDYEGRIRDVYRKRNRLLHQGRREAISPEDLAFTDHLLVNLLANLVSYPKLFRSKADVIKFSERVEAERTLGLTSKVRPKGFRFIRSFHPEF
jgi:hypothetical protein